MMTKEERQEYSKKHYTENKERYLKQKKEYNSREDIKKKRKIDSKDYYLKNKTSISERKKKKYKESHSNQEIKKICMNCDNEFVTSYPNKKCCSKKCSSKLIVKKNKIHRDDFKKEFNLPLNREIQNNYLHNQDILRKNPILLEALQLIYNIKNTIENVDVKEKWKKQQTQDWYQNNPGKTEEYRKNKQLKNKQL